MTLFDSFAELEYSRQGPQADRNASFIFPRVDLLARDPADRAKASPVIVDLNLRLLPPTTLVVVEMFAEVGGRCAVLQVWVDQRRGHELVVVQRREVEVYLPYQTLYLSY